MSTMPLQLEAGRSPDNDGSAPPLHVEQSAGMFRQTSGASSIDASSFMDRPAGLNRRPSWASALEIERLAEQEGEDMKELLKPAVEVEEKAVSREELEAHLRIEAERESTCRSIPFIILYFVVFNVMMHLHEGISDASQVERHIRGMMSGTSYEGYEAGPPGSQRVSVSGHKFLDDIDTVGDVYTFLREALIPNTIPYLGAPYIYEPSRSYRLNQLIGGVQLEQTRRGKRNCASLYPRMGPKDDRKINPFLVGFSCYGSAINDDHCFGPGVAVKGFCRSTNVQGGRRLGEDLLESIIPRLIHTVDISGPRYSLTLDEQQGAEVAIARVRELADANWIDEQTSWVGLTFFMLNPDLAVYSRTLVGIFLLESGAFVPHVEVTTFLAEPYQYRSMLAVDIFWALLLVELFIHCISGLISALRQRKQKGLSYFYNVWTLLDWACFILGVLVVVLWLTYLGQLDAVKDQSMNVAINRPHVQSGSSQDTEILRLYTEGVSGLHANVGSISSFLSFFRFFLSCYNILLAARFFKAFQTQPRLAVVTDTLLESLPDFLHFMVVFTTMLTSFAVAATFLFGHRLLEFSQVHLSIERCLLMLFGSMEYSKLAGEHPVAAFLWFISFMTLMFMLLLNMSLAVIMDVYSGQMGKASEAESLGHQVWRLSQRRDRVPARDVLEAIEDLDRRSISEADLLVLCPRMTDKQASRIITAATKASDDAYNDATSITDATRVIVSVKERVRKMSDCIDMLVHSSRQRKTQLHSVLQGLSAARARKPMIMIDPRASRRLKDVEHRLDQLEGLMDNALKYTENRGRGLRDRLKVMEDQVRVNRNML